MIKSVLSQLHRLIRLGLFCICISCLHSGCVYRVPIQQGNLLKLKDIETIKVGMTRNQVRFALGTPMIMDPFTHNRWDYFYYLKNDRPSTADRRHFIVFFEADKVARIEKPTTFAAETAPPDSPP